ncbi:MAG TPA: galactokinase [Candidatus Acidoferrum sp.]|nr:galactokinase [Candidatus Acidoferrum sp.]
MQNTFVNSNAAEIASSLSTVFSSRFGSQPRIFRAPGRVNLIGEHTDYNDGFVLPAAIDLYTWTAIGPRSDRKVVVYSQNLNESAEISLSVHSAQPRDHWIDYVHGVAVMLEKLGIRVPGANLAIFSNVPLGSGLSSSAALEVSVASALLALAGRSLGLAEIAKLCQRAENEFVGARVGIMDQFASCFGSSGKAILLDCRSLEYKLLPLPSDVAMVICNTMVKHEHSGGEYNDRRAQCEEGVRLLRSFFPSIKALRDVTLEQLETHRGDLPALTYRRCHHVISENERVIETVQALQAGDMTAVGRCMAESHRSLKEDYEVSSPELDIMVAAAAKLPGTVGARMTGGGFGGCTINLVKLDRVDSFKHAVSAAYKNATHIEPEIYVSAAGAGVTELSVKD